MEGQVTLPQDLPGRGNIKQQQSAVKLVEVSSAFRTCTPWLYVGFLKESLECKCECNGKHTPKHSKLFLSFAV